MAPDRVGDACWYSTSYVADTTWQTGWLRFWSVQDGVPLGVVEDQETGKLSCWGLDRIMFREPIPVGPAKKIAKKKKGTWRGKKR
jgi:hypothetical protein